MFSMETSETRKTMSKVGTPLKNSALDFSQVTTSQLGISTLSFIPSKDGKVKSWVSQMKARRRSSVGVRGSPETNSLIRFLAQQRSQTPPSTTPNLQPSPYVPHRFSSLRQKLASFQSLFDLDENQELPQQEDSKEDLSCESSHAAVKENTDPQICMVSATPPLSKKPCMEGSPMFFTHDSLHTFSPSGHNTQEKVSSGQEDAQMPVNAEVTCSVLEYSMCESPPEELEVCHTTPQSPKLNVNKRKVSSSQPVTFFSPPAKCLTPVDDIKRADESTAGKKKHVRFGEPLPPEFFDKTLPPSTPLQKGGTPARLVSSVEPVLRSVLKTPQRPLPPFPQPDFSSDVLNPGSPVQSEGLCSTDNECNQTVLHKEDDEKIILPEAATETCSPCLDIAAEKAPPPCAEDAEQCNTQAVESVSTELQEPLCQTSREPEVSAVLALQPLVKAAAPPRSRSRKRKQPEGSLVTKTRTSRVAAISASNKLKQDSSSKKRFGHKEVDRSLYAKRGYASKNPTLSPITEALSSASRSPTPQRTCTRRAVSGEGGIAAKDDPIASLSYSATGAVAAATMWRKRFGVLSGTAVENVVAEKVLDISEVEQDSQGSKLDRQVKGRRKGRSSLQKKARMSHKATADSRTADEKDKGSNEVQVEQLHEEALVTEHMLSDPPAEAHSAGVSMTCDVSAVSLPSHCLSSEEGASLNCDPGPNEESTDRTSCSHFDSHDAESRSKQVLDLPTPTGRLELGGGEDGDVVEEKVISNTEKKRRDRPKGRRSSRLLPNVTVMDTGVFTAIPERDEVQQLVKHDVLEVTGGGPCVTEVRGKSSDVGGPGGTQDVLLSSTELAERDTEKQQGQQIEAGLLSWQQSDFCVDSVLQPLPKDRRSVRRSMRRQSNVDPSLGGLAWVPHISPEFRKLVHRKSKGCPTPVLMEQPGL